MYTLIVQCSIEISVQCGVSIRDVEAVVVHLELVGIQELMVHQVQAELMDIVEHLELVGIQELMVHQEQAELMDTAGPLVLAV